MIPFSFGGEKMEFGADTWWLVGLAVTIAIGIMLFPEKNDVKARPARG